MWHIVTSFVALWSAPHFSTLSHKRHDFRKKKVIERKTCVLIFSTTSCKTNLIIRRILRDIVINVKTSSCKVAVICVRFYWNLNFLDRFSKKKPTYQILSKSVHWESSCSTRTERRTDGPISFRNFANAPNSYRCWERKVKAIDVACKSKYVLTLCK